MKLIILSLMIAASAVNALPDLSLNWSNLRVSWYANVFSSWAFDGVPRSLDENTKGFVLKDDQCATGGKFLGTRYWYKNDPAVILLFDKNGIIAGLQTSVPKDKFTPYAGLLKYYLDDGDFWTLTAYFVDPQTICTTGRSKDDLKSQGTGTGLWLQYGPNPISDSVSIPVNEEDVKKTKWGFGKCFYTMGHHYWFNVSKDMSCADFVPNCLLYNKGKLTGFCFAKNVAPIDLGSHRYDSPAPTNHQVNKFLDPVPDCFFTDKSYSTLSTFHVFFTDKPQLTSWC